ncbi:MAG TPA: ATP-binding protein [Segetibacter sp.]|jgi:signal transduction histidine kinase/DNA-binding response OmpR family regulator
MNFSKTLLLFVFFLASLSISAQLADISYRADSRIHLHNLRPYTSVFVDSSNKLTIDDVITKYNSRFRPVSAATDIAQPYLTYWLRVSVTTTADIEKWWLLLGEYPPVGSPGHNSTVDVWKLNNGALQHQRTGVEVPRSEKAIKEKPGIQRVFFSSKAGETSTIYLKVYNQFGPGKVAHLELRNPAVGIAHNDFATYTYVMSAVALFFCIMSFFFFFFVRERAYLYFALYTLTLSQHYLIVNTELPFINLYIPEHPHLAGAAFNLLTAGGFLLFLLFGRHFINLPSLSKKMDRFLVWFVRVGFLLIITECILTTITGKFVLGIQFNLFLLPVVVFVIIRFAFFKTVLSRFFVAGALWLICFTILGLLWQTVLPSLPFNPWPVGQMGQLLIYAAGLAYKVRLNEKARAEAEHIKGLEEIKSRFFANISHEFRTPLTLIQGPLQQIEEAIPDVQKQTGTVSVPWRQIKTMRRHTDRLLELVNQLLDLSKLDSGKMKLQVIKGDVLQMLKVLTASFESMAERKGIHFHTHFPDQTLIAFFDKDKLDKIVCNLLGNAFKYTPEQGTVSVMIETEDSRLRISVDDNGPGIPKKELDKVFDRFYQVEGTEDKGSGIGLALVKELVDLYRGQISVSSEPAKGTRFKVSLPIDKSSFKESEIVYGEWKESQPSPVNKSLAEQEEDEFVQKTASLQLPLLLVVEDNTDLRNFICETVQQNYQVIQAANGKEGLEKATQEIPDVIVSDVMMPIMDGFAMTERLKKDERTSHIPVILLTAKAGQQHKLEGLQIGADDYLLKPFDAKELLTRIQNLVNQRKLLRKKFAGEILLKPSEVSVNSADENFLSKVMEAIEANMQEEDFGVEQLSREVAMSRSQLHRKLVALTGQSPSEVLRNTRLLRAKELLHKKAATPSEVAYKVGFNSHTYFSKCFKEEFGITPSEVK